ncbi:hypothetical protein HAX39_25440 [Citrobacter freundii]|nr:hypothetical protein [Citrobacter freundii]
MKQSELPRCPDCGNMPEYSLKPNYMGWVWGELKYPYGHHSVRLNGPAGSRAKGEERLAPQWIELVAQLRKGATL